ncbi:MAG TPA: class I SAM-dependent methyltransferase [Candidatus Wunengus sp. YC61]|uniref:class I SAM-dependent methyltransferase n=1 Tax=Candidatus Wunengus sp. YC61 TaxID=3367698 RepID=UPI004028EF40
MMTNEGDIIISDLEIMMQAKNYRRWIINKVRPYIGNRILEVGGGIGNNIEYLLDRELVVVVDNYAECGKYLRKRFNNQNILAYNIDIADTEKIVPLLEFKFDTILCFNVLEHIEKDSIALQNMKGLLAPDGKIVLIVPAFNFLFGGIDKAVGHKRRYTKNTLIKITQSLGLEVVTLGFMNVFGFFGWFLNNKILNRETESLSQILFFDKYIAPFSEKIERIFPPPFGLSLVGVFRKK